jgi:hypothetical protein
MKPDIGRGRTVVDDIRAVQDVIRRLKRRGQYEELASTEISVEMDALGFRLLRNAELTDEDVTDLVELITPAPDLNEDESRREVEEAVDLNEAPDLGS